MCRTEEEVADPPVSEGKVDIETVSEGKPEAGDIESKGDAVKGDTVVPFEEEKPEETSLRKELLLGLIICFAQVPESVAFAYMANVPPPVALHAAWMVGLICSVFGGRPAMVNGATGAFAAIIGTFLPEPEEGQFAEGFEYLFPSVMMAGAIMGLCTLIRVDRLIILVPATVMIGFCNGLAIVIGNAQIHPFRDHHHNWVTGSELGGMIAITLASMITMEYLPKVPSKLLKQIPSSLCAVIIAIVIEFAILRAGMGVETKTIGDVSPFSRDTALPKLFWLYPTPEESSWAGVQIVLWQGLLLALVGMLESLMTQEVVDTLTKSSGDRQKTLGAMAVGNLVSGFFGGMGGNAMIGLSTINCLNGGRTRVAPTFTAVMVAVMIAGAYPVLNYIPVASLSGIMFVVVIHTFKWFSLRLIFDGVRDAWQKNPKPAISLYECMVIVVVTVTTILFNLVYSVVLGVVLTSLRASYLLAHKTLIAGKDAEAPTPSQAETAAEKVYEAEGPLFFACCSNLKQVLEPESDPSKVDLVVPSLLDYSAMTAVKKAVDEYAKCGKELRVKVELA
jgi:SulP family sulfate permease